MNALLSTFVLATTLGTAAASGHEPDADELARIGTTNRYHFEDDFVEGEVLSPSGALIQGRNAAKHPSLIDIRGHFLDYLYRQSLDI